MGKLVRVTLRDVPLKQRAKAASQLMAQEPGEVGPLLLAALAPSAQSYFISQEAHREWMLSANGSRR